MVQEGAVIFLDAPPPQTRIVKRCTCLRVGSGSSWVRIALPPGAMVPARHGPVNPWPITACRLAGAWQRQDAIDEADAEIQPFRDLSQRSYLRQPLSRLLAPTAIKGNVVLEADVQQEIFAVSGNHGEIAARRNALARSLVVCREGL